MAEKQKKFLELMNQTLPRMSELEQEKLLAFGEGMCFMCSARGGADRAGEQSRGARA